MAAILAVGALDLKKLAHSGPPFNIGDANQMKSREGFQNMRGEAEEKEAFFFVDHRQMRISVPPPKLFLL